MASMRKFNNRTSLAAKFSVVAISLVLVTAVGVSVFTIRTEVGNYHQELLNHGVAVADATARNCEYGVFTEDGNTLTHVLQGLAADRDIVYASVMTADGHVLATDVYRPHLQVPDAPPGSLSELGQLQHREYLNAGDGLRYLELLSPIRTGRSGISDPLLQTAPAAEEKVIGVLRLGLSQEHLRLKIRDFMVSTVLFTALLVIAGSGLSVFLSRRITQPLDRLKRATEEIAKGDFERPIEVRTNDEIAGLAGAFDSMRNALRSYRDQLMHDAMHDALTGLPNRTLFTDRLAHAITIARRRYGYFFAVLVIDLDDFKIINDSLGHTAGDLLLIECGKRLLDCIRPGDTVARLSGDEFGVLLEDISGEGNALHVASRIKSALREPLTIAGRELYMTATMGIALSSGGYETPEQVFRDADTALYEAKSTARSDFTLFEPAMHAQALDRLHMETDLRRAIEHGDIVTYYQPILSVDSKRIVGYEALARWKHEERGIILPAQFIPLAEETGLIVAIERAVLREACRQFRAWIDLQQNGHLRFICVNVAHKQIAQPDLAAFVDTVLRETGLRPDQLKLEITENVLFEHPDTAVVLLTRLRDLGVQLYIDDFGTGYSSLSYLHRLPINGLKIDRSFISRIGNGDENISVIRTIAMLAKDLKIDAVAEGVETTGQLEHIESLRCTYWQGFLFSKPVTSDDARTLLRF